MYSMLITPFFNKHSINIHKYIYMFNYFINYFKRGLILGTELNWSKVSLNESIANVGVIMDESNEK